jgi:hypothetical protein
MGRGRPARFPFCGFSLFEESPEGRKKNSDHRLFISHFVRSGLFALLQQFVRSKRPDKTLDGAPPKRRNREDPDPRIFEFNLSGSNSLVSHHIKVHNHNLGFKCLNELDRVRSICRFAHDFEFRFRFK